MERRLLLAVVLMMASVVIVNILFPPAPPPATPPARTDTAADRADTASRAERVTTEPEPDTGPSIRDLAPQPSPPRAEGAEAEAAPAETVWVSGPLYRLGFTPQGATLVFAQLLEYESLAPGSKGEPVQLVPPGARDFLAHRWVVGSDTLDLRRVEFEADPPEGITLDADGGAEMLTFTYSYPGTPIEFEVRYTFRPDRYLGEFEGELRGVRGTGWWLLSLGPGLLSNESDPAEDYQNNLAFAAKGPEGTESRKIVDVEPGERASLDGPFDWVAVRDKYFVTALVLRPEAGPERRFAGILMSGLPEEYRTEGAASFPVGRDGRFAYRIYLGPQDYSRLAEAGYELDEVTPYGYKLLEPIIRPLVGAITELLVWSHRTLDLSYGWILILFGIAIRVVLFPLYQKSMRAQLATMRVQPLMKEIQQKHKNDPQRLQQEMVKLYKEHKVNPLGGCLPMLLPFPILIALFFVFRDTIEFRGVPFLWLPDLSRADPYYIIPIVMGISVFLLQWVGQRGVPQTNPQMKMMMWIMPVVLTVLFMNFAAGLNLYYATMNLASIPQQLYLAKERRAAAPETPTARAKA